MLPLDLSFILLKVLQMNLHNTNSTSPILNKFESTTIHMPKPKGITVYIETHGCKLNQADSQKLAQSFNNEGVTVVDNVEEADVHVLNTCTVTHVADQKARSALRKGQRKNPQVLTIATGCYAERTPEALSSMDEVDLIFGNKEKENLVTQVLNHLTPLRHIQSRKPSDLIGYGSVKRTRASLKIQEGCNQICAYCIVPKVRGREKSVSEEELVAQVQSFSEQGYQEVILTGTQLGSYGFETPNVNLITMLNRILQETDIPRIRVSSLQPQEISGNLLSLWENPRLCPHFHVPLQSGANTILQYMRRRYTTNDYAGAIKRIRSHVPGVALTTDLIIGFPGETDALFEESYSFCKKIGFSSIHVFPYSERPGTSASYFIDKVRKDEKRSRIQSVISLGKEQGTTFRRGLIGTTRPILWEQCVNKGDHYISSGLSDNYVRVSMRSTVPPESQITKVKLLHLNEGVLWGT